MNFPSILIMLKDGMKKCIKQKQIITLALTGLKDLAKHPRMII